MPDTPGQKESLLKLSRAICSQWAGAEEIDADALAKRFPLRHLVAGWRLSATALGKPDDLIVAVDDRFPWSLPIVALPEAVNGVLYPHVESDGHLCLAPSGSSFELPVGIDHVVQLVSDAGDVMSLGRTAANDADFYTEAQSYWTLISKTRVSIWLAASLPHGHAVWMSAIDGENFVVAPNKQLLTDWAVAGERRLAGGFEPALIVRLSKPLHPNNYPLTMSDLTELIESMGAKSELHTAISRWRFRRELPVVLVFVHDEKEICLGATFLAPRQIRMPTARHNGIPGFRNGRNGRATTRLRALSIAPMRFPHLRVTPVYRAFLHTRTSGSKASLLANLHVAIAGCGALGGQLAVHLAQAGVGRLTLLDDDVLSWQNVGRHVLDGSWVGERKSKALEKAIHRRFPDAMVTGFAESWERHRSRNGEAFQRADLFISVTGNVSGNRYLDELSAVGDAPAMLFGWIEPFGVAAHAVLCFPGGRRLVDISDAYGRLLEPVADVESAPDLPREPACGAFYQPYSSLSALPGVALLAELAVDALLERTSTSIHRVWVGSADEFARNGLSIHPTWHTRLNALGYNRRFDFVL